MVNRFSRIIPYYALITFAFLLLSINATSQITEGFEGAGASAGWTYTSVTHGTNNPRTGARCATFNATNDAIITPVIANPCDLSFWYRRSGTAPGNPVFTVQYSTNVAGPWTDIGTVSGTSGAGFTTTYQQFTANLNGLTNVYIRVLHTRTSGANEIYLDDFSVTVGCAGCSASSEPTGNASSVNVTPGCSSANISFTAGNGAKRLVVVSTDCSITDPADQVAYTASTTYGSGETTGAGDYVVYNSNGNSVNVTGLAQNTSYCIKIYEYNGALVDCEENYFLTGVASTNFTTAPASQPTVNVSNISVTPGCTTADISFTAGNGANVLIVMSSDCTISDPADVTAYTAGAYGSGSTTAAGDYVVYKGNATTASVTGLTMNTSYCFKIYQFNGTTANCEENYLLAGVVATSFTTLNGCATPQIRSILVNSCGPDTDEGLDEYVVIKNGSNSLSINDIQLDFPSGGSYCNVGCGGNTLINNAGYITSLNTAAGCALFQYNTTIPANATIVVFTGLNPTSTMNFSSSCPGPVYAIFCNNSSGIGRFANSAGANRSLTVDFGTSTDVVTFMSSAGNTGDDGDYANFTDAGAVSYGNSPICAIPLPVKWGLFSVESEKNTAILDWSTLTERNNAYFDIEIANENGQDFSKVGQIKGAGSTTQKQDYHFELEDIQEGYYYFRLRQVDFDGKSSLSETRSVTITGNEFAIKKIIQDQAGTHFVMNEDLRPGSVIRLHEITGKLVSESIYTGSYPQIDIDRQLSGMLILSIEHPFDGISAFKVILR
ncbi:MAG: choice-of-anchor J domain-containing protein [Bacteroidota bacterium]